MKVACFRRDMRLIFNDYLAARRRCVLVVSITHLEGYFKVNFIMRPYL